MNKIIFLSLCSLYFTVDAAGPPPKVTVRDIDEEDSDVEDSDDDSDILHIPDETLHDDITSGHGVPETFAVNDDSLSYDSHDFSSDDNTKGGHSNHAMEHGLEE